MNERLLSDFTFFKFVFVLILVLALVVLELVVAFAFESRHQELPVIDVVLDSLDERVDFVFNSQP